MDDTSTGAAWMTHQYLPMFFLFRRIRAPLRNNLRLIFGHSHPADVKQMLINIIELRSGGPMLFAQVVGWMVEQILKKCETTKIGAVQIQKGNDEHAKNSHGNQQVWSWCVKFVFTRPNISNNFSPDRDRKSIENKSKNANNPMAPLSRLLVETNGRHRL